MQSPKLYVGNLRYSTTNDQLQELFASYGNVISVNVIEGKGFGFVEMSNTDEAEKAKEGLDGQDYNGRILRVNEANPPGKTRDRGDRGDRGGDRDRRSGGGGGGRRF
jgi:RNA recognition motif-containing protein